MANFHQKKLPRANLVVHLVGAGIDKLKVQLTATPDDHARCSGDTGIHGTAFADAGWGLAGTAHTIPSLKPAAQIPSARLKRPCRFSKAITCLALGDLGHPGRLRHPFDRHGTADCATRPCLVEYDQQE